MDSSSARSRKVEIIFEQFDVNRDGRLNREEMAALVVAVNPRVKFSDDQISAILDEVFRTYEGFIDGEKGLTLKGLRRTYADGAGDVDRDFEALGLTLPGHVETSEDLDKESTDIPTAAPTDFGGYKFQSTLDIINELKTLVKQQNLGGKNVNLTSFEKEVAGLRSRLDNAEDEAALEAHMAMGRLLLEHEFANVALKCFELAIPLNPNDARALFLSGNSLFKLHKLSEAKEKYEQSLEVGKADPAAHADVMPQVHVNLGIILEEEGLLINACEHYREAAIMNTEHHRAFKLLGSAMFGLGEFRLAKEALQNALFLRPNFPDAQCDLGATLQAMGDETGAKLTYEKALQLESNHINALYNLACLLRDTGQYDQAVQHYAKVLELEPSSWQAQLNQAISYLGANNIPAARAGLDKALQMTKRVELYDMLRQLKRRSKKNRGLSNVLENIPDANGTPGSAPTPDLQISDSFVVMDESKFKLADSCTSPSMLALALDIRAFQKTTRIWRLNVGVVQKELLEGKVPENPRNRNVRKAALELILRRLLDFLNVEEFQESIRALNERLISKVERNMTVDLGKFLALLSLLCNGTLEERKKAAFEGLLWRRNAGRNLPVQQADEYLEFLHLIYPSGESQGAVSIFGNKESLQFEEFSEMIDRGLPVLSTILKLEENDKVRHHRTYCSVCSYAIVGLRFRDSKAKLNLCSNCYSARKVPAHNEQEQYTFKEYLTEEPLKSFSMLRSRSPFTKQRNP